MLYNMYWNNICLVTKMEEKFIEDKKSTYNLPINTTYYGLGRKESMLSMILKEKGKNCTDADIIVSTDTDIFHDKNLLPSFDCFKTINNEFNIDNNLKQFISPCNKFVPFIIIPLVVVYNKNNVTELPQSYEDFIKPQYKKRFAFGGPHNSAGKSIIKSLWYKYSERFARKFIDNAMVLSMPAAAFNAVRTGEVDFAIVPTIFANRADGNVLDTYIPNEGIIPIPSYIAVKNNIEIENIKQHILNDELQELLVNSASIIPTSSKLNKSVDNTNFFNPTWEFLYSLDHDYLRKICVN